MSTIVFFRFTKNCNFTCRHCAYDAKPGGKTLSKKKVEKALFHLPPDTTDIVFTGGEPLIEKETLKHALFYLQEAKESKYPEAKIQIETNGSWVEDLDSAYQTLQELRLLGVDKILLSGFDRYHSEEGLDFSRLNLNGPSYLHQALKRLRREEGPPIRIETFSANGTILPLKRAKKLPPIELNKFPHPCSIPLNFDLTFEDTNITIDEKGDLHLCHWEIPPSIGSVIDFPVNEIINEAKRNPMLITLIKEGIKGLAIKMGIYSSTDEGAYNNACAQCEKLVNDGFNFGSSH